MNEKDQAQADAKAKMLEALAKKQGKNNSGVKGGPASGSKVNAQQVPTPQRCFAVNLAHQALLVKFFYLQSIKI
jgi:hypothetical protein